MLVIRMLKGYYESMNLRELSGQKFYYSLRTSYLRFLCFFGQLVSGSVLNQVVLSKVATMVCGLVYICNKIILC